MAIQSDTRSTRLGAAPPGLTTTRSIVSDETRAARPVWIGLVVVLMIFLILETFIAIRTPPYESADEPGHVQNIETLLSGHWYTMDAPCQLRPDIGLLQCSGDETQQAPLYYALFAGWQWVISKPALSPFDQRHITINPAFFRDESGIFLHHSAADQRFLLWLRLPNILLGALTVLLTFFAVRLVTRDGWTPLVAASFVAFLPRMLFLWPFVTNDNLVNFLGGAFLYVSIRYALSPSPRKMGLVGLVYGLMLLTKLSTLPLVLVLFVLACFVPHWRQRARHLAIGVASTLLVSGWYLVQNAVRYGDPLARTASAHYLSKIGGLGTRIGQPYTIADPLRFLVIQVPQRVNQTFWYISGWNQFHWSWTVNFIFTLVLVGTLLGLLRHTVDRRILFLLFAIWIESALSIWGVALYTYFQARYAYVGLPALAALMALGVQRLKVPARFLLPGMCLVGALTAIQFDVISINWT